MKTHGIIRPFPPKPFVSIGVGFDYPADTTTFTLEVRPSTPHHEIVSGLADFLGVDDIDGCSLPTAAKIIFSGGATIILWDDGTKTVAKCRGGDEFDPLFGIMACIVRKLTGNRGHGVNDNEQLISELAGHIKSLDDIDELIDESLRRLDLLAVLAESADMWMDQLGPASESDGAEEPAMPSVTDAAVENGKTYISFSDRTSELEDRIEKIERERDAIRQEIRDLIDRGEL